MSVNVERLGIIAGNRSLPVMVAREARAAGVKRIVVAAFEGETNPEMASVADEVVWMRVGQLGKLVDAFKSNGVAHCVMAGQIAPKNLFDVRPDLRAMALLLRLKERNAHTIFGGIADELKKDGIELIEATPWLQRYMPGAGFQAGRTPSKEELEDVAFGYRIAKEVSRLEIGQTVVVKEGTVLAVEGFEGTDKCLARGGELAGPNGGGVAVKVAKEDHDMRFDIPCVGPKTAVTCAEAGIAVMAVEARKTLLLDQEELLPLLKKHRLALVTAGA